MPVQLQILKIEKIHEFSKQMKYTLRIEEEDTDLENWPPHLPTQEVHSNTIWPEQFPK